MGGGRQGEPSTTMAGAPTPVVYEDTPFEPEEFFDEHVDRAEQSKELGEVRAESIPGAGQVLHVFLGSLKPVLDKGAELRGVWDRIQGERKTEHEEEAAHRKKEAQIASGEDQELERLLLDMKRAENVLAKQKARITAELQQVEAEVATQKQLSEQEHAAAEAAAMEDLTGIQSQCHARVEAFEADQKAKMDVFRADMDEQIVSVQNDVAEEAANWQAEQDRLNGILEDLKAAAIQAEEPVANATSHLAEAVANREIAYRPVNAAEAELTTHVADSAEQHAALLTANATTDRVIADDELKDSQDAKTRAKAEKEEEEEEQQALYEDSDRAFAEIDAARKENAAELAAVNASLADDDATAETLQATMDAAAAEMNAEEDKLTLMRSEHSQAKSADDVKAADMDKARANITKELKDAREQAKFAGVSAAEGEQAKVMEDIEKQQMANNASVGAVQVCTS
jgi:hypothetical protein